MLTKRGRGGEAGSGLAIGVAITFPVLMLVIVALNMLTESSRIEQALQATANRAARTASLCCRMTGGPGGAVRVAEAALASAETAAAHNRVYCNNNFVGDSRIVFTDIAGDNVPVDERTPVPPGGTVHVVVTCRIPPQYLGGFGLPGVRAERRTVGVASIDPNRYRPGPTP